MGWCNVGAEDGAKAVADLLMFNSTLVTLDLRGNGLGDAGGSLREVYYGMDVGLDRMPELAHRVPGWM